MKSRSTSCFCAAHLKVSSTFLDPYSRSKSAFEDSDLEFGFDPGFESPLPHLTKLFAPLRATDGGVSNFTTLMMRALIDSFTELWKQMEIC